MKKQSGKISYKQTSLSFIITVAPVSVAPVAPTDTMVPTKEQTAATPTAQTIPAARHASLQLLEMIHLKRSADIGLLDNDSGGLKSRRSMYFFMQREKIIEIFCASNKESVGKINAIPGYDKVDKSMVYRWIKNTSKMKKKRGRKFCKDFEDENCILYYMIREWYIMWNMGRWQSR